MNDINDLSTFLQPPTTQVDLVHTLASFSVCVLMSFVLRQVYLKRSFSLSGKHHIGSILPVDLAAFVRKRYKIKLPRLKFLRICNTFQYFL